MNPEIPLRPTYLEVNLNQLAANFQAIHQKVAPAKVMPAVKANAYGHGMVTVSHSLLAHGADMLAVAILDEGIQLRKAGIAAPVLVMGGIQPYQIPAYLAYDLILTVASIENLKVVEAAAAEQQTTAQVHLKIDTGMGRLGAPYDEAESLLEASLYCRHIRVEGIYTHFANSDAAELSHARLQLERFQKVISFYEQHALPRPLVHAANSGAILQLPESYFDLVRPGIMLYGYYPSKEAVRTVEVHPALTWKTRPVLSKIQPPKHPVSYGSTWQSDHPVRILTLPVGYGDGYFRLLSNRGQVLVHGKKYPIVGRVCMDQFMVNLEGDPGGTEDEVVLLGKQGEEEITADDLAGLVGTISYEILTNINGRVPRVYIGE